MGKIRAWRAGSCLVVGVGVLASIGCASTQTRRYESLANVVDPPSSASSTIAVGAHGLDRVALIRSVLAANPGVAKAQHAFRAALAVHPRVSALEAPTLEYAIAPLSIASSEVRFGQTVRIGQRFPWPGKLAAAGEVALAGAEASKFAIRRVQLEIGTAASTLFDRYYATERALELNHQHRALVAEIKAAAEAQYVAGRASQQDVLQAEVEFSHVLHQDVVLLSKRAVIVARLNGLLHRSPHAPLRLDVRAAEPDLSEPLDAVRAQDFAIRHRPELRAARIRAGGRTAAIDLAERAYLPDFGLTATYNSMWAQPEHQWMVSAVVSLPFVQFGARRAGVDEAEARWSETNAQIQQLEDQVRVQVEEARQELLEAQHVVRLYRRRLLVAARARIAAARAGYETGRNDFRALIEAQRSLRDLEFQYEEAVASVSQRRAALSFAIGRMPGVEDAETGRAP